MYLRVRQLAKHPTRLWWVFLFSSFSLFSANTNAATVVLSAIDDFPNRAAGEAPYFADTARSALAINAADPTFRNVFAKATTTYSGVGGVGGVGGVYDVTLVGLAELDGEAEYRFSVNDEILGTAQNPESSVDYMPIAHVFEDITLNTGDTIAVESVANSNNLIPEGEGFAFARGRWTGLRLTPDGETDVQPEKISLITNASTLSSSVNTGDTVLIDYAVFNDDNAGTAATNVRLQFNIPVNFSATELNNCIPARALEPDTHILRCNLSQLAPGDIANGQLSIQALEAGSDLSVHATAIANETEVSGIDNRASVTFDIGAPVDTETQPIESPGSAQTLPESDLTGVPEIVAVAGDIPPIEPPITTSGAIGSGASLALLFFNLLVTWRRFNQ